MPSQGGVAQFASRGGPVVVLALAVGCGSHTAPAAKTPAATARETARPSADVSPPVHEGIPRATALAGDAPAPPTLPNGSPIVPCGRAPEGMACVLGGAFVRGSDSGPKNARPAEKLWLQTFYMDRHEVTSSQYQRCEREGACPAAAPYYADFDHPEQPMTGVSWDAALQYCHHAGKHLPTEAQWEKAARGPDGALHPWGDEPATCERAVIRDDRGRSCGVEQRGRYPSKGRTFVVGTRPAGAYGLHDMAGNAWEWVADWYSSSWAACGEACGGIDPRGPCDGRAACPHHKWRVVRGGSWYWDAAHATGIRRRPHVPSNRPFHHFGFRCAASEAEADALRAVVVTPPPHELTKAARSIVWSSPADPPARELLGVRPERAGRHYLASNEANLHLFYPALSSLGGGYVGVGSDQAYLFIGWMRPDLAWLVDYDPQVVSLHHAYHALIAARRTPEELVRSFTVEAQDASLATIAVGAEARHREAAKAAFRRGRRVVHKRLLATMAAMHDLGIPTWLTDQRTYEFVRASVVSGRVRPMVVNLLDDEGLAGIGASARALGVPIRAVYLSNAEEYWPHYPAQFRGNIAALPFDEPAIVLRTIATYEQNLDYHYNTQPIASFAAWLARPATRNVYQIVRHPRGRRARRPSAYSVTADTP